MKALVVGLGSMGKRRVRNLQALGFTEIAGVDVRDDRRFEAASRYGIQPFPDLDRAWTAFRPDIAVISTSPGWHMAVAGAAARRGVPCFIEASVVDAEGILRLHQETELTPVLMAPSCTMRYFPGPKKVKALVQSGVIGRPLHIAYQTGQFLPDWHPWERIDDFYVSNRETGGCREIVPFELTWLNDIFGASRPLACVKRKLTDMPADIDDVYQCLLEYPGGVLANVTVEVISRPTATRDLRILGTEGEIVLSGDDQCVRWSTVKATEWQRFDFGGGTIETGYINPEEPYIAEMSDFVTAVKDGNKSRFPNSLMDDYRILQVLYELERLSGATQ